MFAYVTITTREALMLALGMGVLADLLAIVVLVICLAEIRRR